MKAILVCSIQSLWDMTLLERRACRQALVQAGLDPKLLTQGLGSYVEPYPMLQFLEDLPIQATARDALVCDYLDRLNDLVGDDPSTGYLSVRRAILQAQLRGIQRGLVSEYPLLTTNLARSAALRLYASCLGQICAATQNEPLSQGLVDLASILGVAHDDCVVLVSNRRDFTAAQSLGMQAKFVEETRATACIELA